MDHKFTAKLGQWLAADADNRDYAAGALMLLQLSGNKIEYANLMGIGPAKRADHIETRLQSYYNYRVAQMTHDQVEEMARQVETIAEEHALAAKDEDVESRKGKSLGKRPDHDSLPLKIQALYSDNLPMLRRMREVHLKLRTLSLEDATCPDSERYPYLKELIALDKKMHKNWETYDTYKLP